MARLLGSNTKNRQYADNALIEFLNRGEEDFECDALAILMQALDGPPSGAARQWSL